MAQLYRTNNEAASIFVATPTIGAACASYQLSLLQSINEARQYGYEIEWCCLVNNCHVDDSRNFLVREFLESNCDKLFFIDADVGWQTQDFIKTIESDKDVVGGIYPKKSDHDDKWPVRLPVGDLWTDEDGWLEVDGLPTGFMCLTRNAVQSLYDAEPKKFNNTKDEGRLKQAIIFERTFNDGSRTGGDYAMCDKWKALGGKMYTDPEMRFVHEGTKGWSGRLSYHLQEKHGLLEDHLLSYLKDIENGDYDDDTFAKLYECWSNGKWTGSVPFLSAIAMMAEGGEYNSILELGSGLSTLILAAIAKRKNITIESVEQDKQYYFIVKKYLEKIGSDISLIHAPLKGGWYDYEPGWHDLVICDGPSRKAGSRAELAKFKDRLGVIIMDDFKESIGSLFDREWSKYHTFAIGK